MSPKHRAAAEQRLWDELVIALAPACVTRDTAPEGCAHQIREIADAIIRERRLSIAEDVRP